MLRSGIIVFIVVALTACGAGAAPTPTAVPSLTPTQAAASTPAPDRYADLPQAATALGFPQLGFPSAPISLVLYSAVTCTDCVRFQADVLPRLVQRARAGEVLLTFVPLVASSDAAGESAARAAYCAGEQRGFWAYLDRLSAALAAASSALTPTQLAEIAQAAGLDTTAWQTCLLSSRASDVLESGRGAAQGQFGEQAYVLAALVNNRPAPVEGEALVRAIDAELARVDAAVAAAVNATDTPSLTSTVDPLATQAVEVTLDPLLGEAFPPPLTLTLPDGWQRGDDTLLLDDVAGVRAIPFTLYTGPVTGGTGSIVLLWRFPSLTTGNPLDTTPDVPDLYVDGLRLLRLAIVEPGCNVGTDVRRTYSLGGMAAVGTAFSAVDCPQLPDTRGWFAGLRFNDISYVFYVYTDPITAMDTARPELQAVLDSLRFEG